METQQRKESIYCHFYGRGCLDPLCSEGNCHTELIVEDLHAHPVVFNPNQNSFHILRRSILLLNNKIDKLMSMQDDFKAALDKMTVAVTTVSAKMASLEATVKAQGLTPEQETAILGEISGITSTLTTLGTPDAPAAGGTPAPGA